MRYRVQYLSENERRTAEVEASSPQEAVVKFRHTGFGRPGRGHETQRVLSVSPALESEELLW